MLLGQPAVVVQDLVKRYGSRRAVDGLSFSVERGEIFALLGPNGAGKSTTVEILEGYRARDAGVVQVLGLDPIADGDKLKPRIGVMLQEGGLYLTITPREALRLFSTFYTRSYDPDEMLALVGLEDASETRYRRLSGGQKQRLSLALALVGRPELVFLDEATAGMDPQARRATWGLIRKLREEGVTVLFTTHYLEEAERLADRVAIVDEGRLIAVGTPTDLARGDSGDVRLRAAGQIRLELLSSLPSVLNVHHDGDGMYVLETRDAPALLAEVTARMREVGTPIVELRVGNGSLEDLFLQLIGEEIRA
ncbi:MAG TPA: ABC transporter ATP-binding protein [Chloroflexota bacterium]